MIERRSNLKARTRIINDAIAGMRRAAGRVSDVYLSVSNAGWWVGNFVGLPVKPERPPNCVGNEPVSDAS